MSHNLEYLLTRPGALKIATVIFGIVAAILNGHSYANSPYTNFYETTLLPGNNTWNYPGTELELTNMTSTFIFLGISITSLAAHSLFYLILESRLNKLIDVCFHISGALFLFAGGIALIYSAIHIEKKGCDHFRYVSTGPTPKHHFPPPLPPFQASSLHNIFASAFPFHKLKATTNSKGEEEWICHYFGEKIVGGSLNILNGVVYGFLAVIIHGTDLEEL